MEAPADRAVKLAEARHLTVPRTARYFLLGSDAAPRARELWIVIHGYGQLAGRFIRHFTPLDDGTRVIVAPEALSRFYLEHPASAGSANTRVGATWMTREDRDAEIADQVSYLDALTDSVLESFGGVRPTLHVLGFSQGVATAARWLTHGRTRADHIVFWAGRLPPELLPLPADSRLRAARVDFVVGDADQFASATYREDLDAAAAQWSPAAHVHVFSGTHTMHGATLQAIARASGR